MERKQNIDEIIKSNNKTETIKDDVIYRCLHQIFRPKENLGILINGVGNCYICKYDLEENKKCKGYQEISICTYIFKKKLNER